MDFNQIDVLCTITTHSTIHEAFWASYESELHPQTCQTYFLSTKERFLGVSYLYEEISLG